jgi:hypothetical protein
MASNINPSTWANIILSLKNRDFDRTMQWFQNQLSQFAVQVQQQLGSAGFIGNLLNGSGVLTGAALASKVVDLGTISTDQTVAVAGAGFVSIRLASGSSQTRIITLTNLPAAAQVMLDVNSTANSLTLKLAATNTSGTAYACSAWNTSTLALADMVATGEVIGTTRVMFLGQTGIISTTPQLNLLYA